MITATPTRIIKEENGFRIVVSFSDDTEKTLLFPVEANSLEINEKIKEIISEKEFLIKKVDELSTELLNTQICL